MAAVGTSTINSGNGIPGDYRKQEVIGEENGGLPRPAVEAMSITPISGLCRPLLDPAKVLSLLLRQIPIDCAGVKEKLTALSTEFPPPSPIESLRMRSIASVEVMGYESELMTRIEEILIEGNDELLKELFSKFSSSPLMQDLIIRVKGRKALDELERHGTLNDLIASRSNDVKRYILSLLKRNEFKEAEDVFFKLVGMGCFRGDVVADIRDALLEANSIDHAIFFLERVGLFEKKPMTTISSSGHPRVDITFSIDPFYWKVASKYFEVGKRTEGSKLAAEKFCLEMANILFKNGCFDELFECLKKTKYSSYDTDRLFRELARHYIETSRYDIALECIGRVSQPDDTLYELFFSKITTTSERLLYIRTIETPAYRSVAYLMASDTSSRIDDSLFFAGLAIEDYKECEEPIQKYLVERPQFLPLLYKNAAMNTFEGLLMSIGETKSEIGNHFFEGYIQIENAFSAFIDKNDSEVGNKRIKLAIDSIQAFLNGFPSKDREKIMDTLKVTLLSRVLFKLKAERKRMLLDTRMTNSTKEYIFSLIPLFGLEFPICFFSTVTPERIFSE